MGEGINTNHIPLDDAFREPAPLYRGAPFWSWNGDIDADEARRNGVNLCVRDYREKRHLGGQNDAWVFLVRRGIAALDCHGVAGLLLGVEWRGG